MGRRKIKIERTNDLKNRDVTFCKRKKGLIKKAEELAILCDVKLGLVVFSCRGKKFEYCSPDTSMKQIFEQYMPKHHEQGGGASSSRSLSESYRGGLLINRQEQEQVHENHQMTKEMARLKNETEVLQKSIRHIMGEDIEAFSINELHQLELQIETALHKVRSWKAICTFLFENPSQTSLTQVAEVKHYSLEAQMQSDLFFSPAAASLEKSFESQMQLGDFSYEHDRYRDLLHEHLPFEFQLQYPPHLWT